MNRKTFLQQSALLGAGMMASKFSLAQPSSNFPEVRVPLAKRHFKSNIIEEAIKEFQKNVQNKELGWLFNNCFPNTLDTTIYEESTSTQKLTYVITGDIDAGYLERLSQTRGGTAPTAGNNGNENYDS